MTDSDDPGPSPTSILVTDAQQIPISQEALTRALELGCSALRAPEGSTLSLSLVDEVTMAARKREAFGIEASTDILSYPIDGFSEPAPGPHVIGDLVLCPAVAVRQANALGVAPDQEMVELLAHGLLHLAGRDHAGPDAEVAMAHDQRALAARMRASNP